ncbi:hypothetical protein COBT_001856 [Conglomerata obtusa]
MYKQIFEFIKQKLEKENIFYNPICEIQELIRSGNIKKHTTNENAYAMFLLKTSDIAIFKRIIDEETVIYDLHVVLPILNKNTLANLDLKLKSLCRQRFSFYLVTEYEKKLHVYIKFNYNKIYKPLEQNEEIYKYAIPYFLFYNCISDLYKLSDVVFDELIFEKYESFDDKTNYKNIVEILKKTKAPLCIINDTLTSSLKSCTLAYNEIHEIELQLEGNKEWPEYKEARDIAKSSFYCMLYNKNTYKCRITKEYFILKYRNNFYKFKIVLADDFLHKEQVMKKKINQKILCSSDMLKDNISIVKKYLGSHGYYPLIINDLYIEVVSLIIYEDEMSPGIFFKKFLDYTFDLKYIRYDVNLGEMTEHSSPHFEVVADNIILRIDEIDKNYVQRILTLNKKIKNLKFQSFNEKFEVITNKLLVPMINDFDIVFSKYLRNGFCKVENKTSCDFELGMPLFEGTNVIFDYLNEYAYFLYSPVMHLLMVKKKIEIDTGFLVNLILSRISLQYIKINN